jgi:uncharacterized protein YjiK
MHRLLGGLLAGLLVATGACNATRGRSAGARDSSALVERESRLAASLAQADTASDAPLAKWVLPKALAEISGIALTPDQRLLAHDDEAGRIFEVDYRRGVIVKTFWVGTQILRDDFESIAVVGSRVFLLASTGRLYAFAEGEDESRVPFTVHDTGLGGECEFEGLAFDSTANALVLACKSILAAGLEDLVVLYKVSLTDTTDARIARITIPLSQAIGANGWKGFTPSDIEVDPGSGDYVIVASQEKGLLRVTSAGEVVWSRPLPPGHDMAEGIAITRDGILIVSDEAASATVPGHISLYRWP